MCRALAEEEEEEEELAELAAEEEEEEEDAHDTYAARSAVGLSRSRQTRSYNRRCISRSSAGRGKRRQKRKAFSTSINIRAKPEDQNKFMDQMGQGLLSIEDSTDTWKQEYISKRDKLRSISAKISPSFYLLWARLALKHGNSDDTVCIATNLLEMSIEDAQMYRCLGYFLTSMKDVHTLDLVQNIFDRVKELQPCEPQSYLDLALVRYRRASLSLYGKQGKEFDVEKAKEDVVESQKLIVKVLTHHWVDRFSEIEYPALILLHCIADLAKILINRGIECAEWPELELSSTFGNLGMGTGDVGQYLRCPSFDFALIVWLAWDTDKTDIDLHVKEPDGGTVYYSNKRGKYGSLLSRDFTNGYGPEVYILKDSRSNKIDNSASEKILGKYEIFAKYYASHQDSALTGATSAVLWTIEKSCEGTRNINFYNVRLDTVKDKHLLGSASVC